LGRVLALFAVGAVERRAALQKNPASLLSREIVCT
jgi:hypothetical protein